jgi:hypothetical protein
MTDNKIEVASCTIAELFSTDSKPISGTLEIPEYQRPYVWTEKEIGKLLSDIKVHKQDNKPMYYLGTIILHKHNGKLSIIDGQQRLTTLAIIQHIVDVNRVPKIKYASPTTILHIQKNHNFLKGEELKYIDFNNLNVTLVVTTCEDDAYTFFETQNTGGIRLSGIDIIKAHHLREIDYKGKRDEQYAITWEKQKNLETVIAHLIKARRWNALFWENVPSDRDKKETKQSIIKDFSEETLEKQKGAAYSQIVATNNYSSIQTTPFKLAIRQPLANGENFIDYLAQFAELYQRLFKNISENEIPSDCEIPYDFFIFNQKVIQEIDGTAYLKELYEIAVVCYANKFGFDNLLEASFWIFRYCYSLRVSKPKMVRELSIPIFLKSGHFIFDIILSSFNHEQLMDHLKRFEYVYNAEYTDGNSVKKRFIDRVKCYFNFSDTTEFDKNLKTGIENKINDHKNGK